MVEEAGGGGVGGVGIGVKGVGGGDMATRAATCAAAAAAPPKQPWRSKDYFDYSDPLAFGDAANYGRYSRQNTQDVYFVHF